MSVLEIYARHIILVPLEGTYTLVCLEDSVMDNYFSFLHWYLNILSTKDPFSWFSFFDPLDLIRLCALCGGLGSLSIGLGGSSLLQSYHYG